MLCECPDRSGSQEKGLLKAALESQPLFGGDLGLIEAAMAEFELIELSLDDVLIGDDRGERDLFVVLSGRLGVQVAGEIVATREKDDYVGEMALIDSAAKRSASVIAHDRTVVARMGEPAFTSLAEKYPVLWRNLAIAMVRRLNEQG